uniref:NXF1/2/3/5-like leucine-rich repeat domain-containing protein n=1 Tax=Melopsittacus undulatus TaxID=13146 RepID=A0A8C6IMA4_MELUD
MVARCGCLRASPLRLAVPAALRMRGRRVLHSNRRGNGSNGEGESNNYQRSSSQMENLRILSLGRNNIKNLNGLEAVRETLEELWISYNFIEKLRGIHVMKKLKVLYMSNNLVKDWAEFVRLAELPLLEDLVFVGNPLQQKFSDQNSWIEEATKRVPKVRKLDGVLVIKEKEEGAN